MVFTMGQYSGLNLSEFLPGKNNNLINFLRKMLMKLTPEFP